MVFFFFFIKSLPNRWGKTIILEKRGASPFFFIENYIIKTRNTDCKHIKCPSEQCSFHLLQLLFSLILWYGIFDFIHYICNFFSIRYLRVCYYYLLHISYRHCLRVISISGEFFFLYPCCLASNVYHIICVMWYTLDGT